MRKRFLSLPLLLAALAACAPSAAVRAQTPADDADPLQRIIVAIADKNDPPPGVASTPRGYGGTSTYRGGAHAASIAHDIAREFGLRELSAWTIAPLRLRCMLYRPPIAEPTEALLARLRADRRVRLAQPVHVFRTLGSERARTDSVASAADGYNDPYARLQHGLEDLGAPQAQRVADGSGVRIAVIDTGIDATHPDLAGRIAEQRDFVSDTHDVPADANGSRHGTEVAGIIAAVANNGIGIVGVAPKALLLSYRACWPLAAGGEAALCDSFTLAQALGAAIEADAGVINLSLSGPRDELLEQLTSHAIERGAIVVGAAPAHGGSDAFPAATARVIAVVAADGARSEHALPAPGRDILTLEPGAHYDFANGSSMAAAHVSGAVALLLQHQPRLQPELVASALAATSSAASASINVCLAMRALGGTDMNCAKTHDDATTP